MLAGKLTDHHFDERYFTFYFMYNDQLVAADYALYLEVYSAIHTTVYLSAFGRGMVHPN